MSPLAIFPAVAVARRVYHAPAEAGGRSTASPELFCGFHRRSGEGPTLYPVACAPQSWAAGSVFLLLRAGLGLEIRAGERLVRLRHPRLPPFLEHVELHRLQVGDAELDLAFSRQPQGVVLQVTQKKGDVEIMVVP